MEKTHELIKSLSKSEKRMIKMRLNASKSDSILNTIFDTLCKQSKFDLKTLSKITKQTESLTKVSLRLLFEVILKRLRSSDSTKSKELELRDSLSIVKLLKDRKLINEASIRCAKLIKEAVLFEEFTVLHEASFEYWNIHLLKTDLSVDNHSQIQAQIKNSEDKIKETNHLESIYRQTAFYYQEYYFKKRNTETKEKLVEATSFLPPFAILKSVKAKHTFYEIKCMESVVLANVKVHYNLRKEQLLLMFSSVVFDDKNLHKLLVLSNIFMFLKTKGYINHLQSYLNFTRKFFSEKINKNQDWALSERYYDIYFQNEIYIQIWVQNEERIDTLFEEFKEVLKKNIIDNKHLVSRIYLAFIELFIISNKFKKAQEFLVDFFYLLKKSKTSINYIEGEVFSIITNFLVGNLDISESQTINLRRKVKRNNIDLGKDLKSLFELLQHSTTKKEKSINEYLGEIDIRMTFKLLIIQLKEGVEISNSIREQHYMIKDKDYSEQNDEYLNQLKRYL